LLITNLLIIYPSLEEPTILRIQCQKKNWKSIYKIRKTKQLSTHRDSDGGGGHSWGEKANALGCSFKKSTKSLTDRDGSVKRLWTNLEQFAKICCHVSTWQWLYRHWIHSVGKNHCLYSPIGSWLRMALITLAYNVTDWLI